MQKDNSNRSDLPYSDPNQLINEVKEKITDEVRLKYDEAQNPQEQLNARLELTNLSLQDKDYEKALLYANEAIEIEGLTANEKLSAEMNLVDVLGIRGDYELGLKKLSEIRENQDYMTQEQAEFYVSRFETAFKDNRYPGPINCVEPQGPEDCPL